MSEFNEEISMISRCSSKHRIWTEALLHYHPGTLHHAGPMSRAYSGDRARHNHHLHAVMRCAFGAERTGRAIIASEFHPDGKEVANFTGCYAQNV